MAQASECSHRTIAEWSALKSERDEARAQLREARKALKVAREGIGTLHTTDASKGVWKVDSSGDPCFDYGDTHTDDCAACALERRLDAALPPSSTAPLTDTETHERIGHEPRTAATTTPGESDLTFKVT